MKLIQEINSLILNENSTLQEHLDISLGNHSKLKHLYGVANEITPSEEEKIAQSLCLDSRNSPSFKFLKLRLLEKLLTMVPLVSIKGNGWDKHQIAYYQCWSDLAKAKILLGRTANSSARFLLKRILKTAMKYEFSLLVMECSKILQLQCGYIGEHLKEFDDYKALYKKYQQWYLAEDKAAVYLADIQRQYITNKNQLNQIQQQSQLYVAELMPLLHQVSTQRFTYLCLILKARMHAMAGKFHLSIQACEEGISFIKNQKVSNKTLLFSLLCHQSICWIRLEDMVQAEKTVNLLKANTQKGQSRWFVFKHLQLIKALKTRDYNEASTIIKEVKLDSRFKILAKAPRERWLINEAYVKYIRSLSGERVNIRFTKLSNEIPLYSKDKSGNFTAFLIIKVAWMIHKRQYQKVINMSDTLLTHCSRYLSQKESLRANYFLKMLVKIVKADFHPVASARKALPYLKKLKAIPIKHSTQPLDLELIDFEQFWTLILNDLS